MTEVLSSLRGGNKTYKYNFRLFWHFTGITKMFTLRYSYNLQKLLSETNILTGITDIYTAKFDVYEYVRRDTVMRATNKMQLYRLTLRRLMSYIYGAPILDVSRSHTTTHHSR